MNKKIRWVAGKFAVPLIPGCKHIREMTFEELRKVGVTNLVVKSRRHFEQLRTLGQNICLLTVAGAKWCLDNPLIERERDVKEGPLREHVLALQQGEYLPERTYLSLSHKTGRRVDGGQTCALVTDTNQSVMVCVAIVDEELAKCPANVESKGAWTVPENPTDRAFKVTKDLGCLTRAETGGVCETITKLINPGKHGKVGLPSSINAQIRTLHKDQLRMMVEFWRKDKEHPYPTFLVAKKGNRVTPVTMGGVRAAFLRFSYHVSDEEFKTAVEAFLSHIPPEKTPDKFFPLTALPSALHDLKMNWAGSQDVYKVGCYYLTSIVLKAIIDGKSHAKMAIPKITQDAVRKLMASGYAPIIELPENKRHKYCKL